MLKKIYAEVAVEKRNGKALKKFFEVFYGDEYNSQNVFVLEEAIMKITVFFDEKPPLGILKRIPELGELYLMVPMDVENDIVDAEKIEGKTALEDFEEFEKVVSDVLEESHDAVKEAKKVWNEKETVTKTIESEDVSAETIVEVAEIQEAEEEAAVETTEIQEAEEETAAEIAEVQEVEEEAVVETTEIQDNVEKEAISDPGETKKKKWSPKITWQNAKKYADELKKVPEIMGILEKSEDFRYFASKVVTFLDFQNSSYKEDVLVLINAFMNENAVDIKPLAIERGLKFSSGRQTNITKIIREKTKTSLTLTTFIKALRALWNSKEEASGENVDPLETESESSEKLPDGDEVEKVEEVVDEPKTTEIVEVFEPLACFKKAGVIETEKVIEFEKSLRDLKNFSREKVADRLFEELIGYSNANIKIWFMNDLPIEELQVIHRVRFAQALSSKIAECGGGEAVKISVKEFFAELKVL